MIILTKKKRDIKSYAPFFSFLVQRIYFI